MKSRRVVPAFAPGLALSVALALAAHAEALRPPASLIADGLPAIDSVIATKARGYTEFSARTFVGWHPLKREMLVSMRAGNTMQIHRVAAPGAKPEQLTDFREPVRAAAYEPVHGRYLVFARDNGGDEVFQLYRLDLETDRAKRLEKGKVTPLSDEKRRAGTLAWSADGRLIAYTAMSVDRHGAGPATTEIRVVPPLEPEKERVVATFAGGSAAALALSPDGTRLLFTEYPSSEQSVLWLIDLASGERRRLTPDDEGADTSAWDEAAFNYDSRAVWAASNRGTEFKHLTRLDLASGRRQAYAENLKWDVGRIAVPENGRAPLAFTTNENGVDVLRLWDAAAAREVPVLALNYLAKGVMSGLRWHATRPELAFSHLSARSPGEVYSLNAETGRLERWTRPPEGGLDPAAFPEPELVRWRSFDGLEITGFAYRPPKRFTGPRPVVVMIHGGPASQARPVFLGRNNYLVNELGAVLVYPNVRGSSGYGKRFLALDNGLKREDSVKDIGALLDWIARQPELDARRVAVAGGSYGGYMSLAVATRYPERIAGAISTVGISNFNSFLKSTESYRRDNRRAEYGDERQPEVREHFDRISPLNNAARIAKPLFVMQGRNDPRVPWTEAEQMVATARKAGATVWYLLALDEGHGFAKKANADFAFYAQVEFLKRALLE
jgi:dipeptidyl aminopeptidase/acylaminoacyl peptidase